MRLEFFQMIDQVIAVDPAAGAMRATAVVPQRSTIFEGHFPGYPIMPGALLLETMAQASGYMLIAVNRMERMPFFAGVRKAKFRRFVPPGTTMEVEAALVHAGSGYAITSAHIEQDGERVCDAELTMRLIPFVSAEMEAAIRMRTVEIGLQAMTGV